MNAMPLVIVAILILVLGYRFYISFAIAKLITINDLKETPASRLYDGQNYIPTNKWVLFGHHFAAIAGAGPLVGPVLAAQFGYMPGFIWMLVGAIFAGAVHDFIILYASVRYDGKSLAEIARKEINKVSGYTSSIAILLILIIAMAGLGLVVVNALAESSWGLFTIASTIPIALFMGVWMFKIRIGKTVESTIIGVIFLTLAVIIGRYIPDSQYAEWFTYDHKTLTILLIGYGFAASVLPVWLLLSPRDYLSSIMKIVVIGMLAIGVIWVAPTLHMPAVTDFIHGGGPIIPGTLFPYLFITIACGAVSGFHALVSSGTTPKMIMKESHIKSIAAGSMLVEALVSILALIAASSLLPLDYFAINVPVEKFNEILPQLKSMGFVDSNLNQLSKEVGEEIAGRTGGAVSLGVGMAQIFSSIPGLNGLMSYWYHFAIMFEALFILTTIDAGTRIGRFMLQEMLGKIYAPFAKTNWLPGNIIASLIIVFCWGYFIYTGSVSTIWPLFGTANQLLASIALAVGTTYIINRGKLKYSWITIIPFLFISITTVYAGLTNILNIYIPQLGYTETYVQGWINLFLSIVILGCALIIFFSSIINWTKKYNNRNSTSYPSIE
ncbi:carbon starvation CstA family protein [Pedobacter glucosidilyticus]|uniref:carbon starvation CstA family protein n=1 Tax=Pedobacter glucosidilyticus TaxID=1122941 RepID=UPI0004794FA9|nr:carbon starvation protein A [Pedobacter glucosidilyticus]